MVLGNRFSSEYFDDVHGCSCRLIQILEDEEAASCFLMVLNDGSSL